MKTKKRFFMYSVLAILYSFYIWNKVPVFIADINYHNSNHAPYVNGKIMKEVDGVFVSQDSISKLRYFVSSEFIQKECNCRICREKESLLVKSLSSLDIIKENKPAKQLESFVAGWGTTVSSK